MNIRKTLKNDGTIVLLMVGDSEAECPYAAGTYCGSNCALFSLQTKASSKTGRFFANAYCGGRKLAIDCDLPKGVEI
jgi:hypothetical protein